MDNNRAVMDDKIELKTEASLPAKTEPTDDEMSLPLTSDETLCPTNNRMTLNCEQLSVNSVGEFNNINHSNMQQPAKENIVTSSQYLSAQTAGTDISEGNFIRNILYKVPCTVILTIYIIFQ